LTATSLGDKKEEMEAKVAGGDVVGNSENLGVCMKWEDEMAVAK
jgi:hypothetical protein